MIQHKHDETWQKVPPTTDKTLRFQKQFAVDATTTSRAWLHVDQVVEHVALWLDNRYLGEPQTPFQPRILELPNGTKNAMLSVEFVEIHDIRMPSIELFHTGPIRIARHKVLCTEATNDRGSLDMHVELDTNITTTAWVRTVITDENNIVVIDDARRHSLAIGKNRLRWTEILDKPRLWQKREPETSHSPLYTVKTNVGLYDAHTNTSYEISDVTETTTGFRTVSHARHTLRINNHIQPLVFLSIDAPPWPIVESRSIVRLTQVNSTDTYHRADQEGVFLCQRLPEDHNHARQVVDLLGHHPSVIAWSRSPKTSRIWRPKSDSLRAIIDRNDGTRPILNE